MPDVIPFAFDDHLIRVVMRDGDPWFVAADVCRVLDIKNNRDAVERLDDDDEKGVALTDTPGGKQELLIVSEGGLYTLVLRSRSATTPGSVAHRFRRWVTGEVLPAIRKTGAYAPAVEPPLPQEAVADRTTKTAIDMVHQARMLWGRSAAKRLWMDLGLPAVHVGADPAPGGPFYEPPDPHALTPEEEDEVRAAYAAGGTTIRALARRFRCGTSTIVRTLRRPSRRPPA